MLRESIDNEKEIRDQISGLTEQLSDVLEKSDKNANKKPKLPDLKEDDKKKMPKRKKSLKVHGVGLAHGSLEFGFDRVAGPNVGQDEFWATCGVQRMLDAAMGGFGATIFAYGQTGSGKTHTMLGKTNVGAIACFKVLPAKFTTSASHNPLGQVKWFGRLIVYLR